MYAKVQYNVLLYALMSDLYSECNYIPKSKQVNEVLGKIHADYFLSYKSIRQLIAV